MVDAGDLVVVGLIDCDDCLLWVHDDDEDDDDDDTIVVVVVIDIQYFSMYIQCIRDRCCMSQSSYNSWGTSKRSMIMMEQRASDLRTNKQTLMIVDE